MSDKKNIDRVYQEQFKDFESTPREQVWKNIEHKLKNKQKRKVILIPLWYKIAGVAALVAIAFFVGRSFFQLQPATQNSIGNSTTKPIEKENNSASPQDNPTEIFTKDNNRLSAQPQQKQQENNRLVNNTSKTNTITSSSQESTTRADKNFRENFNSEENNSKNNTLAGNAINAKNTQENYNYFTQQNTSKNFQQNNKTITSDLDKNNIFQSVLAQKTDSVSKFKNGLIAQVDSIPNKKSLVAAAKELQDETEENAQEKKKIETAATNSKWQIKPSIAPVYYGGLDGGNAIDKSFSQNSSEGEISIAYGINLAYTIAKRWKIRSGIGKVNLSYNINNIVYNSTVNAKNIGALENHSKNLTVLSKKPAVQATMTEVQSKIAEFKPGTLNQKIGYITLPVEVEYTLVDKRFAVNLIGGASTMFLDDNQININSAEGTIRLGESANLNNLSFSTNLGLGLGYELNKKFDLNLEPTFNYQINTFSNDANGFKPYYFGVYTGFSFKF